MAIKKLKPQVASVSLPPALTSTSVPAGILQRQRRNPLQLTRRGREWWLYAEPITPDVPFWGPYSRADALEARRSYLRNGLVKVPGKAK